MKYFLHIFHVLFVSRWINRQGEIYKVTCVKILTALAPYLLRVLYTVLLWGLDVLQDAPNLSNSVSYHLV